MNKTTLDYCVSLRAKGLSKTEITEALRKKGFDKAERDYYVKKSDEVYLEQLLNNTTTRHHMKTAKRGFKTFILILCLLLLLSSFYGYTSIGIIGLFLILSLIRFSNYGRS